MIFIRCGQQARPPRRRPRPAPPAPSPPPMPPQHPERRLGRMARHVGGGTTEPTTTAAQGRASASSSLSDADGATAQLLSDAQVQSFIRCGWMSLGPDSIGLSPAEVEEIRADGIRWFDDSRSGTPAADGKVHPLSSDNLLSEMPGLQKVCRSGAVRGALQSLLGKGYMLHPHGGFHAKPPGSGGQGKVSTHCPLAHIATRVRAFVHAPCMSPSLCGHTPVPCGSARSSRPTHMHLYTHLRACLRIRSPH